MQPTDENLLAAYQKGDDDAFAQLVRRYEKELYHFLYRFLGQASLAEEAFQEAFLQVHLSIDRFELSRRFKPWLYTIAANKARDLLRSRSRKPTVQLTSNDDDNGSEADLWAHLMQDPTTPESIYSQKEQEAAVKMVIDKMPEHFREILLMAYFKQLSYKEMADILEIPLGTVKSRLHAAVKLFSQNYKDLESQSNR